MPLINEPFSFNYFGHIITARSLGPIEIPDISKITSVHVVPFADDGNVVAVNVINRGWDIPGGHIDAGEMSPLDALRREAREEANINILEPVLIDVLTLECATLDLSAKPYMIIYAAEVSELNAFTPNNEVSERSLITTEEFVVSYFGNNDYAKKMIDSSIRAMSPIPQIQAVREKKDVNEVSNSQRPTSKIVKRIRTALIVLPVIAVLILFSFPILHAADTDRRLNDVSLPLSNIKTAGGTNGLAGDRTNISFTVNKHYTNTLEAKDDILKQLEKAGISILEPTDEPDSISPEGDGISNGEFIDAIEISYFPKYRNYSHLTFLLEQEIRCKFESTGGQYAEYRCEGEDVNEAYVKRLASSRAVSSVSVHTSVKYWK